jgi:hypothetical protein
VSSPCPFVLSDRHPHAIEMLEEIFDLSIRDYDVLTLCAEGPVSPMQCVGSRMQSAKTLEQRGLLLYSFRMQRWNLTVTGQLFLEVIPLCLSEYDPVAKKKTPVLKFPCVSTK